MARRKTVVERKPIKVKRTRKITEEQREVLRKRLVEMRKRRKPADYKNVNKSVLALPDDDAYSFVNVKEWIKENSDQVSALNKQAKNKQITAQEKYKTTNLMDSKKAYIRQCEHYLKHGDWIAMFSGKNEEHKVVPKVVAMAYYSDGTPKRTVGFWYPDIQEIWTKDMDESDYVEFENREYPQMKEPVALTDKQFMGEVRNA